MKVWKLTVPPNYMYIHLDSDQSPVSDQYLNVENFINFPFVIRKTQEPCQLYINKEFYDEFIAKIEDLPRIEEEWIESYGINQPTVLVIVYTDLPDTIFEEVVTLASKFVTHEVLPPESGFDYI